MTVTRIGHFDLYAYDMQHILSNGLSQILIDPIWLGKFMIGIFAYRKGKQIASTNTWQGMWFSHVTHV